MNIKIIDNFLNNTDFRNLKNNIFDQDKESVFPWFLQSFKVNKQDNQMQFTHVFYYNNSINSNYFNTLQPILNKNRKLNADGGTIAFKDASASIGSLSTTKFLCRVPIYIREQADASSDSVGTGQLWVHDTTPNELCFTDDAGTDIIGVGKYHYETKYIGYVATATGVYIPMTGYVFEQTSTSGKNEFLSFLAPYNATIQKIAFRSEIAQSGDISCRIFEEISN